MNTSFIVHHTDPDGWCAGALAVKYSNLKLHNEIVTIPSYYSNEDKVIDKLSLEFKEGDTIFVVDMSFTPNGWLKLFSVIEPKNFIWCDHHKSAIEEFSFLFKNTDSINLDGFRSHCVIGKSGCELTAEYLFKEGELTSETKEVVKLIGRYDVWDQSYFPKVEKFINGLSLIDGIEYPDNNYWQGILLDLESGSPVINSIIEMGRVVQIYKSKEAKHLIKSAFATEIDGHKVLALNTTAHGSKIFEVYPDVYSEFEFTCIFKYDGGQNLWKYSLYSDASKRPTADATTVHIGDTMFRGHKTAAGSSLTYNIFENKTIQEELF